MMGEGTSYCTFTVRALWRLHVVQLAVQSKFIRRVSQGLGLSLHAMA